MLVVFLRWLFIYFVFFLAVILFNLWVFCTIQRIDWEDSVWNDRNNLLKTKTSVERDVKPYSSQLHKVFK